MVLRGLGKALCLKEICSQYLNEYLYFVSSKFEGEGEIFFSSLTICLHNGILIWDLCM